MRILHKAVQKLYLFSCPVCGSKLEAFPSELIDIGNKVSKFWCPECNEDRYISWRDLRKKTVYDDSDLR